ncbi:MAG: hypothetical protein M3O26_03210 [Pseudomonadota bacterium]|nr:hypothetical protein [Pseudomonadota bacterium]
MKLALANVVSLILLANYSTAHSAKKSDGRYHPPRTADGHVDFEGTWIMSNLTPLERPEKFAQLLITTTDAVDLRTDFLGPQGEAATQPEDPGRDIGRTVEPIRGQLHSSLIIDPADGKIPWQDAYKTSAAESRLAVLSALDNPEQRPPLERCLGSSAAPPMLPSADINLYRIVQNSATTVIFAELIHDARMIHMYTTHAPAAITSWLGDSIGWWEGDTLVVETKQFSPSSALRMTRTYNFRVSPHTTVIERFTRVSSKEINYVFTVTDSLLYAHPWTGETHLLGSSARLFEYACHEGNYGMRNILETARDNGSK